MGSRARYSGSLLTHGLCAVLWEHSGISVMQGGKAFRGKWAWQWDPGVCVKMWLACDMEVAELGSRRLCRMGSGAAKGGGNEPLVC